MTEAGETECYDGWAECRQDLRGDRDSNAQGDGVQSLGVKVVVDRMHGSAAGGLPALLGEAVSEIRSQRDPLFGGHPPEPLAPYLSELIAQVKAGTAAGQPAVGIVFDGDGDRIAAIDEQGRYCSTQLLMPLLIDHLARARNLPGKVIKTVSGPDLMRRVADDLGRAVVENPVGFNYIARQILSGLEPVGG